MTKILFIPFQILFFILFILIKCHAEMFTIKLKVLSASRVPGIRGNRPPFSATANSQGKRQKPSSLIGGGNPPA